VYYEKLRNSQHLSYENSRVILLYYGCYVAANWTLITQLRIHWHASTAYSQLNHTQDVMDAWYIKVKHMKCESLEDYESFP
jgi:hypothetical protein